METRSPATAAASTLAKTAAQPAAVTRGASERKRIPMSVPVQKLEAPDIPGYHLHWFNGTADRIQRAQDGGYEFVDRNEIMLNAAGIGQESTQSGNTDMGSHVSIVSGKEIGTDGQPIRLILMKIKEEWWLEDQKLIEARNEKTAATLRGGALGADAEASVDGVKFRYVDKARTQIPDLFKPKQPKSPK